MSGSPTQGRRRASEKPAKRRFGTGKKSATDVTMRDHLMIDLLPTRPPGKTVQKLTSELESRGFGAHHSTIAKSLVRLSTRYPLHKDEKAVPPCWYREGTLRSRRPWEGHAAPPAHGHGTVPPSRLTLLKEFAANVGERPAEVLNVIRSGTLSAMVLAGDWYVIELADVVPDAKRKHIGTLRLNAHKTPEGLMAMGGAVSIQVDARVVDVDAISEALLGEAYARGERWLSARIGATQWRVHRSLADPIVGALAGRPRRL